MKTILVAISDILSASPKERITLHVSDASFTFGDVMLDDKITTPDAINGGMSNLA